MLKSDSLVLKTAETNPSTPRPQVPRPQNCGLSSRGQHLWNFLSDSQELNLAVVVELAAESFASVISS